MFLPMNSSAPKITLLGEPVLVRMLRLGQTLGNAGFVVVN